MTAGRSGTPDGAICPGLLAFRHALEDDGWRPSDAPPLVVFPVEHRWIREVRNGWALSAFVRVEEDPTRPKRRLLTVRAELTYPAAERLCGLLGAMAWNVGREVPVPFGGNVTDEISDVTHGMERELARARAYLSGQALAWANDNATLDGWLTDDDRRSLTGADAAADRQQELVMLCAHGLRAEVLERSRAVGDQPSHGQTAAEAEFATRLREFIETGEGIPGSSEGLFEARVTPRSPEQPADPRVKDFFDEVSRDLERAPKKVRWKYVADLARVAGSNVRRLLEGPRAPSGHPITDERWCAVRYDIDAEAWLESQYWAAPRHPLNRVELRAGLTVHGEDDGEQPTVIVGIAGRAVGRFAYTDLPVDAELPESGDVMARLTRKAQRPRFLLEVLLFAADS